MTTKVDIDWGGEGRIIKAGSDQTGRIGKIGQRKQRIK